MADQPGRRSCPVAIPAPLVGREREQATLGAALNQARAGQGSLVLLSGEAGIGKTSLAEWLCAEAAGQGAVVLIGRCYDLTETPPYGPWAEALARVPGLADLLPPHLAVSDAGSQAALFAQVRASLAALAAQQPLVLLLEDLHWADPASLELVRVVARELAARPLLLLATYRTEEVAREHPLYTLLPALVRETRPLRLDVRPLRTADLGALVASRYALAAGDACRLVAWLQARAAGNPFYAGELLHGLEEEGLLQPETRGAGGGWTLGDLAQATLPPLLWQVIEGRIARLGGAGHHALAVAAVLGQEIPFSLWAAVAALDEPLLLALVAAAQAARLLTLTADGVAVRFTHALVREALYTGLPVAQQRAWHRRAGETLAGLPAPDADAVAYHFQRAGDPRAVGWLLRAVARAEQGYAWRSAADRCAAALALLERHGAPAGERGWLAYRLAALRRYGDPRGALTELVDAAALAADAGDPALAACALFLRGNLHCYAGEFAPGLAALSAGAAAFEALSSAEQERVRVLGAAGGFVPDARQQRATLVMRLAGSGRFAEARRLGEDLLCPHPTAHAPNAAGDLAAANASRGVAIAYAALGQPDAARQAFARARGLFQQLGDHFHVGVTALQELHWVALSYQADQPTVRESLVAEAERAWARPNALPADLPRGFARLPVLLVAGDWTTARDLALTVYAGGGSYQAAAGRALGVLAGDQGETALARRLLRDELPAGPDTPVGTANISSVLLWQRLAAVLALAAANLEEACAWLNAHDAWLAWSGTVLGRAEGQLGWAAYHRAAGDLTRARRDAEDALAHATAPRQPLALLAAHRLLGELATAAHRHGDAATHLEQALALADACAAPYDRALTLLALAELRLALGASAAARTVVDEARSLCAPLEARPALARADALAARLAHARAARHAYPADLSAREVEVLRRVAAGESNREIAAALALSVRTVEKHLAHSYAKLGARGRADAVAFAARHGLLPEPTRHR